MLDMCQLPLIVGMDVDKLTIICIVYNYTDSSDSERIYSKSDQSHLFNLKEITMVFMFT